jgi:hypothetical protein
MNRKWFFPLQNSAKKMMLEQGFYNRSCLRQDMLPDIVYELYTCETSNVFTNCLVLVLMQKNNDTIHLFRCSSFQYKVPVIKPT